MSFSLVLSPLRTSLRGPKHLLTANKKERDIRNNTNDQNKKDVQLLVITIVLTLRMAYGGCSIRIRQMDSWLAE